MTRLSAINSYEEGGLKMPDLDSIITLKRRKPSTLKIFLECVF